MATEKRRAYAHETYHGRPVPNFGDPRARLLIVGLAPGAHGANRTGRMFTGDRSGLFLYEAMHAVGLASLPGGGSAHDGMTLRDALITAAARCAPPGNRPTRRELANCSAWLGSTFDAMPRLRVVLCLGSIAHDAVLRLYRDRGWIERLNAHRFGHGAAHHVDHPDAPPILDSYHPSQQNTFTGRLTQSMLRGVFREAVALADQAPGLRPTAGPGSRASA